MPSSVLSFSAQPHFGRSCNHAAITLSDAEVGYTYMGVGPDCLPFRVTIRAETVK